MWIQEAALGPISLVVRSASLELELGLGLGSKPGSKSRLGPELVLTLLLGPVGGASYGPGSG